MPIKKTIFHGLCLLFLVSCQQEDEQASLLGNQPSLLETNWIFQYIESDSGGMIVPPEEFKETMNIYFDSDTSFRAGSPCNEGGGKYVAYQNEKIHVKVLGATKMLCGEANMEWENKFFDAIKKAERYVIEGDRMILSGENRLVFRKGILPERPDCFDFNNLQIDTDLCISTQCNISTIVNGEDITSFYFENDLLKTVRVQYGNPALTDRESQFVYDAEGRLIWVEAVNPVTLQRGKIKELIWTSHGLLEEVITYQGDLVRIRQTFSYDTVGRITGYVHRELGDEFVFRKEYAYDDRGNPEVEKTFDERGILGVTRRYSYDYKTNPFRNLGIPTLHEIEPEVLSYFSMNNVVQITEQFPGQSEVVIRRYVYTYNEFCVPVVVKASFDLCSVTAVKYTYACEP